MAAPSPYTTLPGNGHSDYVSRDFPMELTREVVKTAFVRRKKCKEDYLSIIRLTTVHTYNHDP
jgi:hypothetical protein